MTAELDVHQEAWEKVLKPRLPEPGSLSIEEFQKEINSVNIAGEVRRRNLEMSYGESEMFLKCLPDAGELSESLKMPLEKIKMHLNAACSSGRIMEIRLENTDQNIPRKKTGFVFIEKTVIDLLIEKSAEVLEKEFSVRMKTSLPLHKLLKEIQSNLIKLEGTSLCRIFHFYDGLLEVSELMKSIDAGGLNEYREMLEKKMWKILEVSKISEGAYGNDSENQDLSRRAEDSEKWKSYARDKTFSDPIEWQQTCKALGPFFTFRILMRREKFDDIMALLDLKDICEKKDDYEKILKDCYIVQERFSNSENQHKLPRIKHIIDRLAEITEAV